MRLPLRFTHGFQIAYVPVLWVVSLDWARGTIGLVRPWLDAAAREDLPHIGITQLFPDTVAQAAVWVGAILLLRLTLLPRWLPTWLWCRIKHGIRLSSADADRLRFLFDGSQKRWAAGLDLRPVPSSQRLVVLQVVANRFAAECRLGLPFPEIAAAEASYHASHRPAQPEEGAGSSNQHDDATANECASSAPLDAALRLHLNVLDLVAMPASFEEVRSAYKRKIKQLHPDLFAGERADVARMASDMTQQLNRSFEALKQAYGVRA